MTSRFSTHRTASGAGRRLFLPGQRVAETPGQFGWDGGLGTGWTSDQGEEMVVMLLTQTAWTSPQPPNELLDLRTSAYQAIDD